MTEIFGNTISDQALIDKHKKNFNKSLKTIEAQRDSISSNTKYSHYYDMNSDSVGQNLEVERLLTISQEQINNYSYLESSLSIQDANLERISNLALEAKKVAARAMNHIGKGGLNLKEHMEGLLSALESELSQSNFGLGLWNGSRPSSERATTSLLETPGSTHNNNYYLGDSANSKLFINGQERVYGFNAGEEFIENLVEGLKQIRDSQVGFDIKKYPTDNVKDTPYSVSAASFLIDEALIGLSEARQKLGINIHEIKIAKEQTENFQVTLSDLYADNLNGLKMEDLPNKMIELQMECHRLATQLQITAKFLTEFNITDYL